MVDGVFDNLTANLLSTLKGGLDANGNVSILGQMFVKTPSDGSSYDRFLSIVFDDERKTFNLQGDYKFHPEDPHEHDSYPYPSLALQVQGGKVGIGTTNPREKLEVLGNITVAGAMSLDQADANNGTTLKNALTFGLVGLEAISSKRTAGGNQFGLDFYTRYTNRMSITQSGNVGIGTTSPSEKLTIQGDASAPYVLNVGGTSNAKIRVRHLDGKDYQSGNLDNLYLQYGIQHHTILNAGGSNGNVGIGTDEPTHKFHIVAEDAVGLFESTTAQAYLRLTTKEGLQNRVEITNRPGGRLSLWTSGGGDIFNITRDGSVGIGTDNPELKFDVRGYNMLTDPNKKYNSHFPDINNCAYVTGKKIILRGGEPESWKTCLEIDSTSGNVQVGNTSLNNNVLLFAQKNSRIYTIGLNGDESKMAFAHPITGEYAIILDGSNKKLTVGGVEIDGEAGDVILQNADCAEDFEVLEAETVDAGTVMTLKDSGQLERSTQPYDKRVAGVVSGAGDLKPGLVLGRQLGHTNRLPIALIGKVHCKVDARYSPIEVGDLLTTSSTPGHAMKATDPFKAFGAVIGKALRPLEEGLGLLPILVALQ